MSVVFDFNASLNDAAPFSLMLLSVDLMRMEWWVVDRCNCCVLFLLYSLLILSFVSVVFDFNASLTDVAPVSPMKLPVDLMRIEKWIVDGYYLCCFFCI